VSPGPVLYGVTILDVLHFIATITDTAQFAPVIVDIVRFP
jgi:hypothetical protein